MDCCKHDMAANTCAICREPLRHPHASDGAWLTDDCRRYYAQSDDRNGRDFWTQAEDRLVLSSTHDPSLSIQLGRTIRAIQNRRYILKK